VVPVARVTRLQVELQLVAAGRCQLTEQFVAEPVVAAWVAKTYSKLRPRTVEEVGPVDVLLDQQRDAVAYRTVINISKLQVAYFTIRYSVNLLLSYYRYSTYHFSGQSTAHCVSARLCVCVCVFLCLVRHYHLK